MPTFLEEARDGVKGLLEKLLLREPTGSEVGFASISTCLLLAIALVSLLAGTLLQGLLNGEWGTYPGWARLMAPGTACLALWLGYVVYGRSKVLSALLRLGAILLALVFLIVFLILVLTGDL